MVGGPAAPDDERMEEQQAVPEAPPRRVLRSRSDRVVAGVCGGLGRYTGVDPVVFRIVLAVAALAGGAGVVAYAVAWLVIPEETVDGSPPARSGPGRNEVATAVLLGIGALLLFSRAFGGRGRGWDGDGGLLLVLGLIAAVWFWSREQGVASPDAVGAPPAGVVPPAGGATAPPVPASTPPPPPPPAPRSRLFLLVGSALLLLWGGAALWDVSEVGPVDLQVVLGLSLGVVGAGLVLGAWFGRARALIALGVVLTVAATLVSYVDAPVRGGVGERRWSPATPAELERSYGLTAGDAVLDLSELRLEEDREVEVRQWMGELTVIVPSDLGVDVDARVGLGELTVFDRRETGGGNRLRTTSIGGGEGPMLRLDIHLGMGELEVRRAAS
jgi:phage shock protein PspC (stress-responsive transcriptional regulator)